MIPIVFPDVSHARFAMRAVALALAMCAMTGCATSERWSWRSLGVYKIDINQGNYLSQDMVDKLKTGMTKAQVRATLGTPLVASAFRDSRWDYVYEFTRQGRMIEHRQFTVYFSDEKLARWEGDEMPQSIVELNRAAVNKQLQHIPDADDRGFFAKIFDWFKK